MRKAEEESERGRGEQGESQVGCAGEVKRTREGVSGVGDKQARLTDGTVTDNDATEEPGEQDQRRAEVERRVPLNGLHDAIRGALRFG